MHPDTPQIRTFRRAVAIAGDETKLARALGVTLAEVQRWLSGESVSPTQAYLDALEIVARGSIAPQSE